MRRTLAALAVLALTTACDGGVDTADPDDMRLELISGYGQVGHVITSASAMEASAMKASAAQTLDLLPEPIVARVTDGQGNVIVGQSSIVAAGPMEPGLTATLQAPPNTLVRFAVPDSFGAPVIGYGIPDDSGYVQDRWERGTKAGEACMDLRLLVGDSLVTSEAACSAFLPGPVDYFFLQDPGEAGIPKTLAPGDSVDIRVLLNSAFDEHRNPIPDSILFADVDVGWAWRDRVRGDGPEPTAATDSGWAAVAPDWAAAGFETSYTGDYAPGLLVWLDGSHGNGTVVFTGVDDER